MAGSLSAQRADGTTAREWKIERLDDVVAMVRDAPGLFIGEPNLTRLYGFLLGFQAAGDAFDLQLVSSAPGLPEFHNFVARRFGRTNSEPGWCALLLEAHSNEQEAFRAFFELWDEHRGDVAPIAPG